MKHKGIETYYSEGAGIPAREMAERSDRVLSYYRELGPFKQEDCQLLTVWVRTVSNFIFYWTIGYFMNYL